MGDSWTHDVMTRWNSCIDFVTADCQAVYCLELNNSIKCLTPQKINITVLFETVGLLP